MHTAATSEVKVQEATPSKAAGPSPQTRYWNSLFELVFHSYLLQEHCQDAANIDRWVKAFLAITSTTSLGIWAVFKAYPQLWAAIIVTTQIVSAMSKQLPFSARLKASSACVHEYREILNWAEAKWCEIIDGELTDQQINKARSDMQARTAKALKAHFPLDGLPRNDKFNQRAVNQAEQYLQTQYGEQ